MSLTPDLDITPMPEAEAEAPQAPAPSTPRRFRVLNPNGIPATDPQGERIPIMHFRGVDYYEGEVFDQPDGLNPERILRQGYVEEVEG